jgi:hypothetical protein
VDSLKANLPHMIVALGVIAAAVVLAIDHLVSGSAAAGMIMAAGGFSLATAGASTSFTAAATTVTGTSTSAPATQTPATPIQSVGH